MRILGLTAADISTTKGKVYDWGVLGLGSIDGAAGVLSSFRCHKRSRGEQHARERLAKVAPENERLSTLRHVLVAGRCPALACTLSRRTSDIEKGRGLLRAPWDRRPPGGCCRCDQRKS